MGHQHRSHKPRLLQRRTKTTLSDDERPVSKKQQGQSFHQDTFSLQHVVGNQAVQRMLAPKSQLLRRRADTTLSDDERSVSKNQRMHPLHQDILSLQHVVGNQAVQRMLVELDSARSMAASVTDNKKRLRKKDPVEYRDAGIADLHPGEVLHLMGHASPTTFGGRNSYTLAHYIINAITNNSSDLKRMVNLTKIQLHGCESKDFASELEWVLNDWLRDKEDDVKDLVNKKVDVQGIPGYFFVSSKGNPYSVGAEKGDDATWGEIKDRVNQDRPEAGNTERDSNSDTDPIEALRTAYPALIPVNLHSSDPETLKILLPKVIADLESKIKTAGDRDVLKLDSYRDQVKALMEMVQDDTQKEELARLLQLCSEKELELNPWSVK